MVLLREPKLGFWVYVAAFYLGSSVILMPIFSFMIAKEKAAVLLTDLNMKNYLVYKLASYANSNSSLEIT